MWENGSKSSTILDRDTRLRFPTKMSHEFVISRMNAKHHSHLILSDVISWITLGNTGKCTEHNGRAV